MSRPTRLPRRCKAVLHVDGEHHRCVLDIGHLDTCDHRARAGYIWTAAGTITRRPMILDQPADAVPGADVGTVQP